MSAPAVEAETPVTDPARVAQAQLYAYNARDIDAFMAWWADDAEIYAWPSDLMARGAAQIRERHIVRFREPDLWARIVNRMALGNLVVDEEIVTRNFPEGRGTLRVVAIYEIAGGKIARAWFKTGEPVLEAD